jgi:hypothetical protein
MCDHPPLVAALVNRLSRQKRERWVLIFDDGVICRLLCLLKTVKSLFKLPNAEKNTENKRQIIRPWLCCLAPHVNVQLACLFIFLVETHTLSLALAIAPRIDTLTAVAFHAFHPWTPAHLFMGTYQLPVRTLYKCFEAYTKQKQILPGEGI